MEETTWEQKLHTLTHLLTTRTTAPSLHSQFLVSSLVPCYLRWDYPPLLCSRAPSPDLLLLRWSLSLFLRRLPRLGLPETSWRCKCPYQQPPPPVLAAGVGEARWGDAERREYFRRRLRRGRLGREVNPLVPILVPNLLLFSLLLWDPFHEEDRGLS
ncbi:uncharacterized protein LOC104440991 [Eucalyptus grandis]|uniref:uncharacterized protein LOC104440991 n=1 Tax=Eucalyptus grandis TaxID=71139 RepID=UPI00192E9315|nr:uncharacterized protein LOC104440991 [Eucalyptus grandis]